MQPFFFFLVYFISMQLFTDYLFFFNEIRAGQGSENLNEDIQFTGATRKNKPRLINNILKPNNIYNNVFYAEIFRLCGSRKPEMRRKAAYSVDWSKSTLNHDNVRKKKMDYKITVL